MFTLKRKFRIPDVLLSTYYLKKIRIVLQRQIILNSRCMLWKMRTVNYHLLDDYRKGGVYSMHLINLANLMI